MIKYNKWKLLISSIATLLPALFGLAVWDILPEQIEIHWGVDGTADGWAGPLFAVLFMPVCLLALHWLCLFITAKDRSNREQHKKVFDIAFWICPAISLYTGGLMYAIVFGLKLSVMAVSCVLLGLLFLIMGNYMPKCKQNRTLGIKTTWAIANEQNWNATHRFGGKFMVAVGAAIMLCAFLPPVPLLCCFFALILAGAVVPSLYSYLYYKKQLREGGVTKADFAMKKSDKIIAAVVSGLIGIILAVCAVISFTGDITVELSDDTLLVTASYHQDLTIDYADIEHIEYRETDTAGERIYGFGSPRLLMGRFQNEEFGNYPRYSYTACDACVVLTVKGRTVVLSGPDAAATKALYDKLTANIQQIRSH